MADCHIVEVKFDKVRNPFTKKSSRSPIHKYKRNKNRKLRRKRNHIKYFEQLRYKRNSEQLCSSVALINITDMRRESSEKHPPHPPEEISQWQYHHQLAYWKSRAISLEYENRMLHEHIRTLYTKQINEFAQLLEGHDEVDDSNVNNTELEMDAAEIGEKCERLRLINSEEELEQVRLREMENLYGEMAPKINAMETAMKVSYDLQLDKYNPPFWPNLPLNL